MDHIDKLFLREQQITIQIFEASKCIGIDFALIPESDVLEPLQKVLNIPGVFDAFIFEPTEYRIYIPDSFAALEVAVALAKTWKEQGKSVEVKTLVAPCKFKIVNV